LQPISGSLLAILLLLPGPTRGDDLAERVAAFERAFRPTDGEPLEPVPCMEAAERLVGLDAPSVAEAVTHGWERCEEELASLAEELLRVEAGIHDRIAGQEFGARSMPLEDAQAFEELKARARALGQREEGLRDVEAVLGRVLEGLSSEPSLEWLFDSVVGAKRLPLSLRLAAARALGPLGAKLALPLGKSLARAKEPEDTVVLLAAASACGKAAQSCAPAVVQQLAHADATVRENAAYALARLAAPAGIEPLVLRLARETGHTRMRMAIALEILTGRTLGDSPGAWKAWLAKEGAPYLAGEVELGTGRSSLAEALSVPEAMRSDGYYAPSFYGIPQDGHAIVYVIDCSGSMVLSTVDPRYESDKPVDAGPESRIAATKKALIEALGKLSPRDRFDIVCFNDVVRAYSPRMVAADPEELRRAGSWVAGLAASNATNIHDALREAFRLAGLGARDKYYESAVDTIFLLTDGTPTRNDGQLDSEERIFASVSAWNLQRRVVIHTIGIGRELNRSFLERIALENGGRSVAY
jgi:hypothetical protein